MKSLTTFICALLVGIASAIPVPPSKPVDLEGTVVGFVWLDRIYFEAGGDRLRLASSESPPQYIVILKTNSIDSQNRRSLTSMTQISDCMGVSHMITRLHVEEDEMLVQFSSPKIPELKAGSRLELKGYSLFGDEWGIGATFKSLRVGGKPQPNGKAEQAAPGQPAIHPESKSEGNQKPQPESEGRSR
jgi:hypothetical protein